MSSVYRDLGSVFLKGNDMTILNQLRNNARLWWHHSDLRKRGQVKEARTLEHKSVRSTLKNLRDAVTHGGYLSLAGAQWSLNVFEHAPEWTTSKQTYSVSGYYGVDNTCYIENACKLLNIPVLDSRGIDEGKRVQFAITMPMIGRAKGFKDESPVNSMSYVSINTWVRLASEYQGFKCIGV